MSRPFLSGYKLMWIYVMFDLPTVEKKDRKEYTEFRNNLLDMGFLQAQYSVYYRLTPGKETVEKLTNKIKAQLPKGGIVQIFSITDKQYANMQTFVGRKPKEHVNKSQLTLF